MSVNKGIPLSRWTATQDRAAMEELDDLLRQARDAAHVLAVHRRMKLAGHAEAQIEATRRLVLDLRGRNQRGEPT